MDKLKLLDLISDIFLISKSHIHSITPLKEGMTNDSFVFCVDEKKYIIRIPGAGTDKLINRYQEYHVYNVISEYNISDPIVYFNPENGIKITEFLDNSRTCNPNDLSDVKNAIVRMKFFHSLKLTVDHTFKIFELIDYYQSLWSNPASKYSDYELVKTNVLSLRQFIESFDSPHYLTHIDAVPDNFLFTEKDSSQKCYLIDWEYSGMQDQHLDIAMFCIYSMYEKEMIDQVINFYFDNQCDDMLRAKIYAYISIAGLLWSNWCEYKEQLGENFGVYAEKQYLYAKEYHHLAKGLFST